MPNHASAPLVATFGGRGADMVGADAVDDAAGADTTGVGETDPDAAAGLVAFAPDAAPELPFDDGEKPPRFPAAASAAREDAAGRNDGPGTPVPALGAAKAALGFGATGETAPACGDVGAGGPVTEVWGAWLGR